MHEKKLRTVSHLRIFSHLLSPQTQSLALVEHSDGRCAVRRRSTQYAHSISLSTTLTTPSPHSLSIHTHDSPTTRTGVPVAAAYSTGNVTCLRISIFIIIALPVSYASLPACVVDSIVFNIRVSFLLFFLSFLLKHHSNGIF